FQNLSQAYSAALGGAVATTWTSLVAWYKLWLLVLTPPLRAVWVCLSDAWPVMRALLVAVWDWQAAQPTTVLLAEIGGVLSLLLLYLLQRFIARRRYVPRARAKVAAVRHRVSKRYHTFIAEVEKKSNFAARTLPHACFWIVAVTAAVFAPDLVATVTEGLGWDLLTVFFPVLSTLFLVRGLKGSPPTTAAAATAAVLTTTRTPPPRVMSFSTSAGARGSGRRGSAAGGGAAAAGDRASTAPDGRPTAPEVSKALMYWVIFAFLCCCHYVVTMVPFVPRLLERLPMLERLALLFFVWLQLPGPVAGIHVVYAVVEPLIQRHIRNVRSAAAVAGSGARAEAAATSRSALRVAVVLRLLSEKQVDVIEENIADSWMLLPCPLFLFTPGFITYGGCVYTGMVVPVLNSIKTLARIDAARAAGGGG
ncbi:unnamed protein product, partial [Phaeothamnion confervicola]